MRYRGPLLHMAFLLAALLACGKSSSSTGGGDPPAEAATAVQASTLIADYKGNEVRGDNKWKGKMVSVTGFVGEIKKDFTDSTYVTLGTGADLEFETVHCSLASGQEGGAAALSKGQRATMKGRVSGLILLSVMVKDCTIVPTAAAQAAAALTEARGRRRPHPAPAPAAPPRKRDEEPRGVAAGSARPENLARDSERFPHRARQQAEAIEGTGPRCWPEPPLPHGRGAGTL